MIKRISKMEMVKKQILAVLLCVMALMLNGCGGDPQPNEELIRSDLESALTGYKDFLTLENYEIEKSETNDNDFFASVSIDAISTYAEYSINAEINYTKYDQGWQIDDCEWLESSYEITQYPTEEDIENANRQYLEGKSWGNNYVMNNMTCDGDTIICNGVTTEMASDFIALQHNIENLWVYNEELDEWEPTNSGQSVEEEYTIDKSIEGTYTNDGLTVVISNVTETGFDLSFNKEGSYSQPTRTYEVFHIGSGGHLDDVNLKNVDAGESENGAEIWETQVGIGNSDKDVPNRLSIDYGGHRIGYVVLK